MEEEAVEISGTRPIKKRQLRPKNEKAETQQLSQTETNMENTNNGNETTAVNHVTENPDSNSETPFFDATERKLTETLSKVKPSASGNPLDSPVIEHDQAKIIFSGDVQSPLTEQITVQTPPPPLQQQQGPQQHIPPVQSVPPVNTAPPAQEKEIIYPNQSQQKDIRDTNMAQAHTYATENLKEHDKNTQAPGNPALTTMSRADVEKQTAQTVETAIYLYCKIKESAVNFVGKTSPRKLTKLERQGKIDRNWAVFFDGTTQKVWTVAQMVEAVNKDVEKAGKTDPAFIEKIRPLLLDEFTKRGWALSPQQNIFILLGQDILQTVQTVGAIKLGVNDMLNKAMKEYEVESRGGGFSQRQIYNKGFFTTVDNPHFQPPVQQPVTNIQPETTPAPPPPPVEEEKKAAASKDEPKKSEEPKRKTLKPQD